MLPTPCPDCTWEGRRTVFHMIGATCPFNCYPHGVPCRGATLKESIAGLHTTHAADRYCDVCRERNLRVRQELAARAIPPARRAGGRVSASPAPTLLPRSGSA